MKFGTSLQTEIDRLRAENEGLSFWVGQQKMTIAAGYAENETLRANALTAEEATALVERLDGLPVWESGLAKLRRIAAQHQEAKP